MVCFDIFSCTGKTFWRRLKALKQIVYEFETSVDDSANFRFLYTIGTVESSDDASHTL